MVANEHPIDKVVLDLVSLDRVLLCIFRPKPDKVDAASLLGRIEGGVGQLIGADALFGCSHVIQLLHETRSCQCLVPITVGVRVEVAGE